MPLTKLQFKPGVNREITSYSNEGGWFDGDKIRFRFGFPEKIGGWLKQTTASYLGVARALHPWVTLERNQYLGVGTNKKYYINYGNAFYDVTPIRFSNELNEDISVSIVGVSASTGVGTITKNENIATLTGVEGTGTVGTAYARVNDDALVLVSSPEMVGSVGEVTISGDIDASASVTGVETTGSVGTVNISTKDVTVFDDLTFAATDGSSTITVTVNQPHGAVAGDFVTFSGVNGLGGNITADILNQEYEIDAVTSPTVFTFTARTANTPIQSITVDGELVYTPVVANSLDSGDGGITSVARYQLNTGIDTVVYGSGWGAGTWSRGTWGSAADSVVVTGTDSLRLWNQDNFGEDLLINPRDGSIYYWDSSDGVANNRAVALQDLTGATSVPTTCKQVMVADERHVIAFGCDTETNPGVQDPLALRFSDQESLTDWATTATNTAGELRLSGGSEIIQAVKTRQQIIIFTDTSLYAMQYLGPPFTYGVNSISQNITIIGPKAAVAVDDNIFWMGTSEFYLYGGNVQRVPCSVRDYVFDDLNEQQAEKIFAGLNAENSEIWWFYPSSTSATNDRYVVYNYLEKVWYYGTLERTAWVDRGIFTRPIAASTDYYLYNHEEGFDDGSTSPASAISAYVKSSPIDIQDGENFTFIRRMLPDVGFRDSTAETPNVDITTEIQNSVGGSYSKSTISNIESSTEQVHLRLRGRQFSVRVESDDLGVAWRLGSLRYDLRTDGRR
jgi:hypothetical protein